jgi:hypothetical protein
MLRNLISRGEVSDGLEAAVPMVRQWKHAALPRHLSEAEIAHVVEFCANGTPLGRRNYAILLVLARFGLRANEVAQLALDDIDWVAGHAAIRGGKTRHELRLPLPNDIEWALIAYRAGLFRSTSTEACPSPRLDCGDLLWLESDLSPFRVKDHDGRCFHAVIDEDIRFAFNLDPRSADGFEDNRSKWLLVYSFQNALSSHTNSENRIHCSRTAMQAMAQSVWANLKSQGIGSKSEYFLSRQNTDFVRLRNDDRQP